MSFYIKKNSGEKELFDINKFKRSLRRSGAHDELIDEIAQDIEKLPGLRSTREIYNFALNFLQKDNIPIAARYNIKRALQELGPSGFPFEFFVAEIFKAQGYTVLTGQEVQGACIQHEVDVLPIKDEKHFMVECKFHNRYGLKTDVKVALYVKARFDDIKKAWEKDTNHGHKFHQAWITTNTKFTTEAIKYAQCVGIQLLGWSYPAKNNLQNLIDKFKLHPITALPSLSNHQKRTLVKDGFVLCKDARNHQKILKKLGLSDSQIKKLVTESEAVCKV